MGNSRHVVMVGDRRVTVDGKDVFDPRTKLATCTFPTARCLMAFTGLAQAGSFRTDEFVLQALWQEAGPDYSIARALEGVRERLTTRFRTLGARRPEDKRLSLFFFGYDYGAARPLLRGSLISGGPDVRLYQWRN